MSSKVPGFIFYPGDYLQDTQNLSADAQTAYDRIMCLHMKNICISKQQLDFFTKRLNSEQKNELLMVLVVSGAGEDIAYQIGWVADSILKYKKFCESRSNNRKGKKKEQVNNTPSTSEQHMENESESVNEDEIVIEDKEGGSGEEEAPAGYPDARLLVPQMLQSWKQSTPSYPDDPKLDAQALLNIATFLCKRGNLRGAPIDNVEPILEAWAQLCVFIAEDRFYRQKSLKTISNGIQEILQKALNGDQSKTTPAGGKGTGKFNDDKLKAGIRARVAERERAQGQAGTG